LLPEEVEVELWIITREKLSEEREQAPSEESPFDMPVDPILKVTSARRTMPLRVKNTEPMWKP